MGSWPFSYVYTFYSLRLCYNKEYTEIKVLFHISKDKD